MGNMTGKTLIRRVKNLRTGRYLYNNRSYRVKQVIKFWFKDRQGRMHIKGGVVIVESTKKGSGRPGSTTFELLGFARHSKRL